MADWSEPTIDSLKVDVLDRLKLRDVDAITLTENPTNPVVGSKRWYAATKTFQEWTGSGWVDLVISLAGGGTGNSGSNGNFGTMAYQNSDNVAITGGSALNLLGLSAAGNSHFGGVVSSGPGAVVWNNTNGQIVETAIADGTIYTRNAGNETITGSWHFNNQTSFGGNVAISANDPGIWLSDADAAPTDNTHVLLNHNNKTVGFYLFKDDLTQIGPLLIMQHEGLAAGPADAYGGWKFHQTIQVETGNVSAGAKLQFRNGLHYPASIEFIKDGVRRTQILAQSDIMLIEAPNININAHTGGLSLDGIQIEFISANTIRFDTPVVQVDGYLHVGGGAGVGIAFMKSASDVYIRLQQTAANTYFHTADGNVHLGTWYGDGAFSPVGGIALQNGTPEIPSLRFLNAPTSGIYINPTNSTIEFGASFTSASRSVIRAYLGQALVDMLIDGVTTMQFYPNRTKFGATGQVDLDIYGTIHPSVTNSFYLGTGSLAWNAIYSLNPLQVTSDIRMKDVHGPLDNVLDIVDSIHPFIASFKDEFRPKEFKGRWDKRFPSMSAQDIRQKVDEEFGVSIVDDSVPDTLSMSYERLIPILWQAVRELYARVKEN